MSALIGRREFITAFGAAVAWPMAASAQQRAMAVIGRAWGTPVVLPAYDQFWGYVRTGLAELGYVEDQNYRIESRNAGANYDLMPGLMRELVDQKVTLIIASSTLQLEAAKAATQSIPIVFSIGTDPVENGYIASLNKPGGNLTGIYILTRPHHDCDRRRQDPSGQAARGASRIGPLGDEVRIPIRPGKFDIWQGSDAEFAGCC